MPLCVDSYVHVGVYWQADCLSLCLERQLSSHDIVWFPDYVKFPHEDSRTDIIRFEVVLNYNLCG